MASRLVVKKKKTKVNLGTTPQKTGSKVVCVPDVTSGDKENSQTAKEKK